MYVNHINFNVLIMETQIGQNLLINNGITFRINDNIFLTGICSLKFAGDTKMYSNI